MAVSVSYTSAFDNASYGWNSATYGGGLDGFLDYYVTHVTEGSHTSEVTGKFSDDGSTSGQLVNPVPFPWNIIYSATNFSGSEYGFSIIKDGATPSSLGFVVTAGDNAVLGDQLHYTFFGSDSNAGSGVTSTHTLYGTISSITFGINLDGSTLNFGTELFTISGLDAIGLNSGVEYDSATNTYSVIGREGDTVANDTHEIIYGLMNGDTSALEAVLTSAGALSEDTASLLALIGSPEATEAELTLA